MQIGSLSNFQVDISSQRPSMEGRPPSHEEAVSHLGASLSEDQQGEILSGIQAMREDGASDEEIKAYVNSSLEDYGIEIPEGKGSLMNTVI